MTTHCEQDNPTGAQAGAEPLPKANGSRYRSTSRKPPAEFLRTLSAIAAYARRPVELALPDTDNFQNWPPWRSLVVETAHRILNYTGGTLVMPMTVLVEPYWREISHGLAAYGIPVRHFVLHTDQDTLRRRIQDDSVMGPSAFRFSHLSPYNEAFQGWLGTDAHIIDTSALTPAQAASEIVAAVNAS